MPSPDHFHRPTPSGRALWHDWSLKRSISGPLMTTFPLPAPKSYVYPMRLKHRSARAHLPATKSGMAPPGGQSGARVATGGVVVEAEVHALTATVGGALWEGDTCAIGAV